MSPNDQITLGMDRAAVFDEMGDPIASVRERVALEPLLDKAQASQNPPTYLAHDLKKIPKQHLQEQLYQSDESLRPWIELAHILNNSQADIQQQLAQLDSWKKRWPEFKSSAHVRQPIEAFKNLVASTAKVYRIVCTTKRQTQTSRPSRFRWHVSRLILKLKKTTGQRYRLSQRTTRSNLRLPRRIKQALNDGADMIIGAATKACR